MDLDIYEAEDWGRFIDERIANSLDRILIDLRSLHGPDVETKVEEILLEEIRSLRS